MPSTRPSVAQPLVSIVMPVFNGARYLRESLDSILAQTHSSWQLVIVDDGSTDETPRIVGDYVRRDSRVETVRHERNRGVFAGLNTGFARARGDYLTWTSDDNRYAPGAFAEMGLVLGVRPDIDLVYSDYTIIDEHGNAVSEVRVPDVSQLVYQNVIGGCFLYRRRVYDELGDYGDEPAMALDFDYWLRVSTRFRMAPLHKILYEYRYHPGSLTSRRPEELQASVDLVLERNLPRLHWAGRMARAQASKTLARRVWLRGERRMALRIAAAVMRPLARPPTGLAFSRGRLPLSGWEGARLGAPGTRSPESETTG
jgi:glycosyltransferase involved in cell wall biosynthesis